MINFLGSLKGGFMYTIVFFPYSRTKKLASISGSNLVFKGHPSANSNVPSPSASAISVIRLGGDYTESLSTRLEVLVANISATNCLEPGWFNIWIRCRYLYPSVDFGILLLM